MKAIRGATTVAADTPEEIRGAVSELLAEIKRCNKLDEDDIVCILFFEYRRHTVFLSCKGGERGRAFACGSVFVSGT